MREYLIRRTDGEWFDLPIDKLPTVLRPTSVLSEPIKGPGDFRIRILDAEVSFSYEDPGIQVSFESGTLSDVQTGQIVQEILTSITALTGQKGRIVQISF